jgi:hypothetical protein
MMLCNEVLINQFTYVNGNYLTKQKINKLQKKIITQKCSKELTS